jgi:hypothetical protein
LGTTRGEAKDATESKAASVARSLYPELLDQTRYRWLKRDTQGVLDNCRASVPPKR